MKLENLIEQGANVIINYFCKTIEEAEEKLSQYLNFGDLQAESNARAQWLYITCGNIKFVAYYGEVE